MKYKESETLELKKRTFYRRPETAKIAPPNTPQVTPPVVLTGLESRILNEIVERVGMGIKRMREALAESGLKEPTFDTDGYFRAVFYRPEGVRLGTLGAGGSRESSQKGSQKTSQKIISLIVAKPEITIDEMADKLDISSRAVKKHLHNLKSKGLLKRIGPDKGGYLESGTVRINLPFGRSGLSGTRLRLGLIIDWAIMQEPLAQIRFRCS